MNLGTLKLYALAYSSAFALQLWFDVAAYAANHKEYTVGILVSLTYPLIAMIPMVLVINAQSTSMRFRLAAVEGLGYATATGIFFVVRDS